MLIIICGNNPKEHIFTYGTTPRESKFNTYAHIYVLMTLGID